MSALASGVRVLCDERPDGTRILRTAEPLGEHPPTLAHTLRAAVEQDGDRVLAAERDSDG